MKNPEPNLNQEKWSESRSHAVKGAKPGASEFPTCWECNFIKIDLNWEIDGMPVVLFPTQILWSHL